MRIILVRHGDAHAGFHGPIGGPTGCRGLTELGRHQAGLLRDRLVGSPSLSIDAVVTSEIPRAIETAAILASALGVSEVPRDCSLCEVHTGEADGVDWSDYPQRFGAFDMVAQPDRPFAPGGDSWTSFHARIDAAMHRLATAHAGRTLMVVCHAGVIAASLRTRLGIPVGDGIARLVPTHTGLTEWECDDASGGWTLRAYNDARHLERTD